MRTTFPMEMAPKRQHLHIVALETIHCPIPEFQPSETFSFTLQSNVQTSSRDIPSRIGKADVVLITTCRLDEAVLHPNVSPNLKLILIMAAGTDCVDLSICRTRGIRVINCPGANVNAVSEHAIGLYFAVRRSTALLSSSIAGTNENKGSWVSPGCLLSQMQDGFGNPPLLATEEVMGIIGLGKIGKRVASIANNLGMTVLAGGRKGDHTASNNLTHGTVQRVQFTEILKRSTVIVVIVPLCADTKNLLSRAEFEEMRPEAILINLSRGGVVDEAALLEALRLGRKGDSKGIAGAACDVFEKEPATRDNNILVRALFDLKRQEEVLNLTLTPHVAWYSNESVKRLQAMTSAGLEGWIEGDPTNVVA